MARQKLAVSEPIYVEEFRSLLFPKGAFIFPEFLPQNFGATYTSIDFVRLTLSRRLQ